MRTQELYLLSLTISFALTTIILSLINETQLDLYVSIYIIEYFIFTLLHSPFKPRISQMLDLIRNALFLVFVVIVAIKVWGIIFGSSPI